MPVTDRQIDPLQGKHADEAVDVVGFHHRRPRAIPECAIEHDAVTRAPDGPYSEPSQLADVAIELHVGIGGNKKCQHLGYDRNTGIGEKLISFSQLENREYP